MKIAALKPFSILLALSLAIGSINCGGSKKDQPNSAANAPTTPAPTPSASPGAAPATTAANFSDAELDELFAPIALYPDPLLAQIIPAATFGDEINDASRTLNGKVDDNLIDRQNWDVSVKAVAHYPQVLNMMADKPDWTAAVGQAYVNQSSDVMKSIQRLRTTAKNSGALVSTPQQKVEMEGDAVRIEPAQPQVIYVPQYNPEVVYVDQGPSTGTVVAATAIAFGAGLAIGAWLNRDYNWYGPGPYYHGWAGGGWVGVNRNYVNVNNNVYVNNNFNNINVNRNVVNRNITNYRSDINNRVTNNRGLHFNRNAGNYNPANRPANLGANRPVGGGERLGENGRDATARNDVNRRDNAARNGGNRTANRATAQNQPRAGRSGHTGTGQNNQARTHQTSGHNRGGQKSRGSAGSGRHPRKR